MYNSCELITNVNLQLKGIMKDRENNIYSYSLHVGMSFLHKCFAEASKLGVSRQEVLCISKLLKKPGATQKQIGDELFIDGPNMSRLIDGLVTKGLVERKPQMESRRSLALFLTKKGENMADQFLNVMNQLGEDFFKVLSDDEKEMYFNLLKKIAENKGGEDV